MLLLFKMPWFSRYLFCPSLKKEKKEEKKRAYQMLLGALSNLDLTNVNVTWKFSLESLLFLSQWLVNISYIVLKTQLLSLPGDWVELEYHPFGAVSMMRDSRSCTELCWRNKWNTDFKGSENIWKMTKSLPLVSNTGVPNRETDYI